MKKKIIRLSAKEDAVVTRAAKNDPDARPFTDKQWDKAKSTLIKGRGRPLGSGIKKQVTLRIDAEVLEFYKSKGDGWQTFINTLLGEIKRESKSIASIEKKVIQGNLIAAK